MITIDKNLIHILGIFGLSIAIAFSLHSLIPSGIRVNNEIITSSYILKILFAILGILAIYFIDKKNI